MTRLHFAWLLVVALLGSGCPVTGNNNGGDFDGGINEACPNGTSDCGSGRVCISGRCNLPGAVGPGGRCSATRDCISGLHCNVVGICSPGGTKAEGQDCQTDGDCIAPTLRCVYSGFSGTCQQGGQVDVGSACTTQQECLPGLFCGVNMTCQQLLVAFPPWPGVMCPPDSRPFRSYFEVPRPGNPPDDFFRLPYPNDIRVTPLSGTPKTLDLSDFPDPGPTPIGVDLIKLYVDALSTDFDGFGATTVISFRFTSELRCGDNCDPVSSNIKFINLTTMREQGAVLTYTGQKTQYNCGPFLTIGPDIGDQPLRPGHQYAIVLTNGIVDQNGGPATREDDLIAVLGATRPASDAALQHAWDVYAPLRAALPAFDLTPERIINAAVFTVQDSVGHMERLADAVEAEAAPVLSNLTVCGAGVTGPCGADDAHSCGTASDDFIEIQGKFTVPVYQKGTAPYLTVAEGGEIEENPAGVPQKVRTEEVCFSLTLPKGSMPADGWPLMVYGHGTAGSMRSFIRDGIAKSMATGSAPTAVFSYDSVNHGARRGSSTKSPNELVFNAVNPYSARDNFLQGAGDILQSFKLPALAAQSVPSGPTFKFDPDKLTFFGHSQGANHGQLALPYSDAAGAAVMSGAGANLTQSLLSKTAPVNIRDGMKFLLQDQLLSDQHPAMVLFQTWFERSDPVNYNRLIIKEPPTGRTAKKIWMSWGTRDTFTPAATLCWNSRMLDIALVAPMIEGGAGNCSPFFNNDMRPVTDSALFQYDTPAGVDGHFVAWTHEQANRDWQAFIKSWISTGSINVP